MYMSSGTEEAAVPTLDASIPATLDLNGGGHTIGAENPAVTLMEFGDYECPHCGAAHPVVSELVRRLPNELALEFHHFPLGSFPNSVAAAMAAEAAGEQGRFWEMHAMIFESQSQWSGRPDPVGIFTTMAGQLGLDTERFREDMQSQELQNRIIEDRLRGNALGVQSTPTFFIDGQRLDYVPATVDEFEALIRSVMGQ